MRKITLLLVALALVLAALTSCGGEQQEETTTTTEPTEPVNTAEMEQTTAAPTEEPTTQPIDEVTDNVGALVGVAVFNYEDAFLTGVRGAITAQANVLGADIEVVDSEGSQEAQDEQIDAFLADGVAALAINAVDRTTAGAIIEKAKAVGKPIVFFNREPTEADLQSYDKAWYVGAKAEEAGRMMGEILADYWKENNLGGSMRLVLLLGEPGHQDTDLRTEHSIKAIEDAGIQALLLASDTGMWEKERAATSLKTIIDVVGIESFDAIIANNDDMALGAIEVLKGEGYNAGDPEKYIPVVGVDATGEALNAMANGELLGTVFNDAEGQGKAVMNIAAAAAQGLPVDSSAIGYEVTDEKYVWLPYVKVTAENYQSFMD